MVGPLPPMPSGKSTAPRGNPDQPEKDVSASSSAAVSLDEVIITAELQARPKRRADYRAEAEALGRLGQTMATSPDAMFQQLVNTALELCGAQSSGISLL